MSVFAALADRYDVRGELGRGGMATVFLAEERKHARKVAIKVLHPELTASVGTDRFLREVRIAARLAHPHIVPLIDSGQESGMLFYVAPYVAGGSLRDRLRAEQRLSVSDALRIVREVGSALQYANAEGFVHRDVKPENVLFAAGHALLADFGIARATCEACEPMGPESVTAVGLVVGTPEYMSPEQASGDEVDGRSDEYALACVLYEMLAGEPPFRGPTARGTMAKHATEPPRALRALRPEVPPGVERAVARALSKDPGHRFPCVGDFVAALDEAAGPSAVPPAVSRSIAVLPFVDTSRDADSEYLSDGLTDELIDALVKVEGLRVASRTSVFALKGKAQDVRTIAALLGVSVVLEGTVRRSGDRLRVTAQLTSGEDGRLLWSQRYDRTLRDVFVIQDEIAGTIVNTLRSTWFADLARPPARHYTDNAAAYTLYLRGRYEWNKRTQEGVREAIRYFEAAAQEDPDFALAYTGLADAYALEVDYRDIPVHDGFRRAKEYARRALALDDTVAEAHASLAWSLFIYDWDLDAACAEFRRAVELDPLYATAHQWYAFALAAQGRLDEALVEAHTAVELDAASVSARRSLGWLYFYARRWDRARYHLNRAIAMNPTAEETYRVLGLTLAFQGEPAEAERVLREGIAISGGGSYTRATLGYTIAIAGRPDEARVILAELEAQAKSGYVSPAAFATLSLGLGDADAVFAALDAAHADRRGWLAYLDVNPIFDPVRDDPRFTALRRRVAAAAARTGGASPP